MCGTVLPDGFVPDGKTLDVRIGGVSHEFVLDRKGKAKDDAGSVSLKFKKRKGFWRVSVALKMGDFRAAWSDDGLSNATQKKTAVSMRTIVLVDGMPCFATTDQLYTAKQDEWGKLEQRRRD